ncbi:MAG: ABC transporter ATP-binding protein [Propionicimonas sp.]|uniref:ABC transporter ATP-binding protein n=1 Tax=Propionicimonas sp. TaxID=1955623 RepID=UPI002B1F44A9|nr:ABC transporter ATP-binding protein [Propionicimonas sp.]MEA4943558.1 ABC transporter ATP-binding protein [Propionicimonas sp.]MEA5055747.1 ABC transporter ATP-binding protein [Propionicimonas sp.]MEA5116397.1 ABC transporter ATP-binding protein [Propionicimonas sp.]
MRTTPSHSIAPSRHEDSGVGLEHVTISYGPTVAVSDADFIIEPGTFFTLLGPSGCGKTTLLRAIAGFIRQTSGDIRIGEQVINDVPAHRRDAGMVFQNYAIFPHLTVRDNVAYGLKARQIPREEAESRIAAALQMVDLTGYASRLPKQLSGGQQQRVVIARALAVRPRVLLMDEPLANLDAKLRVRLRGDIRQLQTELGITTIYVTHDQEEALAISDRIAVMSHGLVEQVGTPMEIYQQPATLNVARFIGEGNFVRTQLRGAGATRVIDYPGGHRLAVESGVALAEGPVWVGFRPQDADILGTTGEAGAGQLAGVVMSTSYLGSSVELRLEVAAGVVVLVESRLRELPVVPRPGDLVRFRVRPADLLMFPGADDLEEDE